MILHPLLKENVGRSMLLWCVVVGSCAEAFPVEIEPSANVRQLFDSIKSINSPMFSGIDFSKVELFLAKDMDGEWLHADAPEMSWLMYGDEKIVDLVCRNVLDPETKLEELFKSDPRGDQTQIVVQIVEYPEEEQNGKTLELQCLVVGGANSAPFVARVKDTNDFHKLKRNIIASSPKDFYLMATSDLHLYLAQNRQREWLAEDHPDVAALCKGESSALDVWLWNVMHPSSTIGNQFNSVGPQVIHVLIRLSEIYVVIEDNDDEHRRHKKPFCDVAEALKNTPEVTGLVGDIKMAISIAEFDVGKTPFIILANSSGTGKTQMAFNLMAREEVGVFYIACGGVRENVHKGFSLRSSTFRRCVEKDMTRHLSDGTTDDFRWIPHCMTFAFIWALLTGNSKFDRPRTHEEVFKVLEDWKKCGKWPVFFLDDFPRSVRKKNASAHQFMRNVFRSFGIPAILSARNTSAASVVSTEPVWHGGRYAQWCTVWTTLPPFQYLSRRALEPNLQEIVQHSKPSLSKLAVEYAHANPFSDGMDFVEYIDAVAESLVSEYISMNHVTRLTFRMEQICLIYAANNGMRVPRGESEPDTLSYLINNNFARLHESEPFTLERGHSPFPLLDCAEPTTWQFLTDIPGPQCDALLHLCLMGGKTAVPSKSSNTPISFRQAFETANFEGGALKFDFANADHENSIAAGIPRETLVAGALVSASRQNGFAGIAFPEFLSFLMYELGIQTSPDIRVNLDADVLELVASLKVPFLAPLDAEWPDFLTRTTLNLGLLFEKRDADRSSFSFVQDQITIECNICRSQLTRDFILGIFKRVPTTSRVHVVILNSLQSLYFFHEEALRDGREYPFQNTFFYRVRSVRRASCPESCVKLQVCRYIQDKARVVKKTTCQRIVIFVELSEIEAPRA